MKVINSSVLNIVKYFFLTNYKIVEKTDEKRTVQRLVKTHLQIVNMKIEVCSNSR